MRSLSCRPAVSALSHGRWDLLVIGGGIGGAGVFLEAARAGNHDRGPTAEGLALADVLNDTRDGLTISQIADTARPRDATAVIVPRQSRLAGAYTRLAYELERHGIRCVLIGATAGTPVLSGRITTSPRTARADATSL
jgi:hypothetical protein